MVNHTRSSSTSTPTVFTLFPELPPELRFKILDFALSAPRVIFFTIQDNQLSTLTTPHPLLHTNDESRTRALRTHTRFSEPKLLVNTEMDHLFLADEDTLHLFLESNTNTKPPSKATLGIKLRRLAVSLSTFEPLLKEQEFSSLRQLFQTFPNLEEVVLVVGEKSDEVLKQGDAKFVMPRDENLPRKGALIGLCMEVLQPWRAFAHLVNVKMLEDVAGERVEAFVMKDAGKGEWKVPTFKIREVRFASGPKK
ncbi:hypothetical protein L207DRAFT_163962 [Hyaloscypha variabilis F]|uniref:2EXR domain-containing protein n=1 Tax=Hyaloscypha variabilis (strain UAMH 11265 / GT02V1 / F) TaxID=1149755 RepID=A0A2J6SAK0_HYAVF|nr:hypothetical protein L207DRAFT_163962 [Hyaloscypha variabilis F]